MGMCASLPSISDTDRRDLLAAITIQRDVDGIKTILDQYPGINLNSIDLDQVKGENALHMACSNGLTDMVDFLITYYQMDVNHKSTMWGYTPLINVILRYVQIGRPKAMDLMRRLIFTYGCDVNITDDANQSPLHWCATLRCVEGVQIILESGKANVNIRQQDVSSASLEYRQTQYIGKRTYHNCTMGVCTSCQSLSEKDRRDLLAAITIHRDFDGVKTILDKYPGINLNRVNLDKSTGENALHLACSNGLADMIDFLINYYQMDVNHKSTLWEYTPLIALIRNYAKIGRGEAAELMRRLIFTYGCDVNITDDANQSPLHWCAILGYVEGVQVILRSGKANVNIKQRFNKNTALDEALINGNTEIASLLDSRS